MTEYICAHTCCDVSWEIDTTEGRVYRGSLNGELFNGLADLASRIGCSPETARTRLVRGVCLRRRPPPQQNDLGPCMDDGCSSAAVKSGRCAVHYSQWKRDGGRPGLEVNVVAAEFLALRW